MLCEKSYAYKEHMIPIYMKFLGESYEPLRTQDLLGDTYAKKWKPEYIYKVIVRCRSQTGRPFYWLVVLKYQGHERRRSKHCSRLKESMAEAKMKCDVWSGSGMGKNATIKNHPGIFWWNLNIDCRSEDQIWFCNLLRLYKIMSQFLRNIH